MMNGPDDTSRERPDRPNDPPQSPPGAENGHAIPFGEGVYGLGRNRQLNPRPHGEGAQRPEPDAHREPPAGDHPYGEPPPVEPRASEPRRHEPPADEPPAGEPSTGEPSAGAPPLGEQPPNFDFRRLASELGFESHQEGQQCVGFCPICRTADVLRTVTTPELRAAWSEFQRELAHALRAAAERYVGPEQSEPAERITEIPID